MGRQGGRTAGGVREPAESARAPRQAPPEEARRVDRALLRPLLRDRGDETNASPRTGEHSEATVDSRLCVQSEPDLPADSGRGNAAGAEKPAWLRSFGVYLVASWTAAAGGVPETRSMVFTLPNSGSEQQLWWLASLPKNRGLHHGLLAPTQIAIPFSSLASQAVGP